MLLFIRLAVEEGRTLQHIHSLSYSFILQAQAQLPESLPAFSIAWVCAGYKVRVKPNKPQTTLQKTIRAFDG